MSDVTDPGWDARVHAVWAAADERSDDDVVAAIEHLAAERSPGDPDALHELASACDYAGREAAAEPLYRRALDAGLAGERRASAVVQLASTLRNLGRAADAVDLLEAEIAARPQDALEDARAAFLALALADTGRHDMALRTALTALVPHLPRYQRAVRYYADELARTPTAAPPPEAAPGIPLRRYQPDDAAADGEAAQAWNPMAPELLVSDLARSRHFYVDVIGFDVRFQRDDPPFCYLDLGGAQLMLEQDHVAAWRTGDITTPRGRGVNLQVEVPDLAAVEDALAAAGLPLFRATASSTYDVGDGRTETQRELLVQDPDGYLVRCVEVVEEPTQAAW